MLLRGDNGTGGHENDCSKRKQEPVSGERQNRGAYYTDADEIPTDETKRFGISMSYGVVDDLPEKKENWTEEEKPKGRGPIKVR